MKKKLKKVGLFILRIILPRSVYCMHIEKKHNLEYRSTVVDNMSLNGPRLVHINTCGNCKMTVIVNA